MPYAPYYNKQKDRWQIHYDKPDGRLGTKTLGQSKREAMNAWKRMDDISANPSVIQVADRWMDFLLDRQANGDVTKTYVDSVRTCLDAFLQKKMKWMAFTPEVVSRYCADKQWAPDTISSNMTHLRSLSRYGHEHHGLVDTLLSLNKPPKQRREKVVSEEEYHSILDHIYRNNRSLDHRIAYILAALWHTGARPGELMRAKRSEVHGNRIVQLKHKNSKKSARPRVIYLTPAAQIAVKMSTGNKEFIFCDSRGQPWHKDSLGSRMRRVLASAGLDDDIVAYSFRHAYATRALVSGVDIAVLAELMGTSVQMIVDHYGHLSKRSSVLENAALSIKS